MVHCSLYIMDPSVIPEEIWLKILHTCDVVDILAVGSTCWYLYKITDSPYLWESKWEDLKLNYSINLTQMQLLNVNYKKMCYRLQKVMMTHEECVNDLYCGDFKGFSSYSIHSLVSHGVPQVVLDIGNKFTWVGSTKHVFRKHLSVFGIPKLKATSQTCDKNVTQKEPCSSSNFGTLQSSLYKSFCVVCKHEEALKDKQVALKDRKVACKIDSQISVEHANLKNGFCREVENLLDMVDTHVVSPAAALLYDSNFPLVRDYLSHLFNEELVSLLKEPNMTLVFCEPLSMSSTMKQKLVRYLFETVKLSRVCLMPKPLAASSMLSLKTSIVIDTGAFDTYVAVVVDDRVVEGRWRHVPVGGWHIAENLEHAVRFQSQIPLLQLDNLPVKLKCRLSYDFAHEEKRKKPARREDFNFMVESNKPTVVLSLGEELYRAPEVMYAALNLPQIIRDITQGLPHDTLLDCISHILVTGGNANLTGLKARLARDLRDVLPDLKDVVNVESCSTSTSYCTLGSVTEWLDDSSGAVSKRLYGTPLYITQVEYVAYGCQALDVD